MINAYLGIDIGSISTKGVIIDADNKIDASKEEVRFSLKPHKTFIFNKETEERIYTEEK